ncbi:MAG: 2-dehydropantoate 2-reductase [Thermaerobacter sp.]|nr:2-dehydropantoate 2-reductase [Thermaerobacter sp.]
MPWSKELFSPHQSIPTQEASKTTSHDHGRQPRRPATIAVIGAGAIGCYLAAESQKAGHHVTVCVRTPFERLLLETAEQTVEIPVAITSQPQRQTVVDWVFLTTKTQDTAGAKPWLQHLVGPGTVVVVLQNGITHRDRLLPLMATGTILPALVYVAAERVAPGHVIHRGGSHIVVPASAAAAGFADLLQGTHTEVRQDTDFATAAWRKLLSNVAANPLTTLTVQRLGVLRHPDIARLARGLLRETVTVARAEGAQLGDHDVEATLDLYSGFSLDSGTSMLYDRLANRPLEYEAITGEVVRLAERHGLDIPLNQTILALLRGMQQGAPTASP